MNKPLIPKDPKVPGLTQEQIEQLTDIVFLQEQVPKKSDVIFVFGGTHPGNWEAPLNAYQKGLGKKLLITGNATLTGKQHPTWEFQHTPESHVIRTKLIDLGIPEKDIIIEDQSTNSLQNVLFSKLIFDFTSVKRLVFVCKSHTTGRMYRTLAKHLPSDIEYYPFVFSTSYYNDSPITRYNWMQTEKGRSRVYGEYLRICLYGEKGDILKLERMVNGLEI